MLHALSNEETAHLSPARSHWWGFVFMDFNEAIGIFNDNRELRVKSGHVNGQDKELRNFAVFMHNCPIEKVNDEHIVKWLKLFKTMGYQSATLAKKEQALIQFYKFWQRKGLDVVDPLLIPMSEVEYQKPKVCSEEKYLKLLEQVPLEGKLGEGSNSYSVRNRAMISLIWNTGMRRQELIGLNVGDINTEKKVVTIKTAKSKGVRPYRLIPYDLLDSEAVKAVLVWLKARERILKEKPVEDDKALFIAYKTNKILGKRFSLQGLGEVFARVSNKAGFTVEEYVNPHSLRHHFGHVIAKRVKNPYIVSGSLGHASLQSSMRYTQLEDGDLVDTLRNGE